MQMSKNLGLLTLTVLSALGQAAPQKRNGGNNNKDDGETSAVDAFFDSFKQGGSDAGGQSEGDAAAAASGATQAGDDVTKGFSAKTQAEVDSGELTCQLNSNKQVVCSDISGASNIIP
ncbi:hypothetical protein INS49_009875 [Diaporthe citri]|uniref:uncharacterized protein n=1 Tax=Diaporthe citri TaxID=83186 RepID=UPI001C7F4085|nr:uncharacterized protein INS49_009875 [Diaporthe citri]KAG6361648.1 hypothetical protein INS49_009875 [Diaporthe citri]